MFRKMKKSFRLENFGKKFGSLPNFTQVSSLPKRVLTCESLERREMLSVDVSLPCLGP